MYFSSDESACGRASTSPVGGIAFASAMGALPACAACLGRTAATGKRRAVDAPGVQSEEQVAHAGTTAQEVVSKLATATGSRAKTLFEHYRPQRLMTPAIIHQLQDSMAQGCAGERRGRQSFREMVAAVFDMPLGVFRDQPRTRRRSSDRELLRGGTPSPIGALSRWPAWRSIHVKACQSGRLQLALVGQLGSMERSPDRCGPSLFVGTGDCRKRP